MNKFDMTYNKIIFQMAGQFKNVTDLFLQIKNCKNGKFFNKTNIIPLLKKDQNFQILLSKCFQVFDIGFYVFKIHLSKYQQVKQSILSIIPNADKKQIKNVFNQIKQTPGSLIVFQNDLFLFLNIDLQRLFDQKVIYHQFTHFKFPLQNKRIAQKLVFNQKDLQILKNHGINISKNNLQYLMTQDQQQARINDFCYSLDILKQKKYDNLSRFQFISKLFDTLRLQNPTTSQFVKQYNRYTKDQIESIVFYISYFLNIRFEKIKSIIMEYFK